MWKYKPAEIDGNYIGSHDDKQRFIDGRDYQLLLCMKANGWPTCLQESDLGIDGSRDYEIVYKHSVQESPDAIVIKGPEIPKLVVRTDGREWRVISTLHTWSAAEPSLVEQHNELDSDPLARSMKFRKPNSVLFLTIRNEPQILRLHLSSGNVQVLELKTDGLSWVSSLSMINGREATREQRKAVEHAVPLSEPTPTHISAILPQCRLSSES